MNTQHNALTMRADGRARAVESQVEISLPSDTPEEAIKKIFN